MPLERHNINIDNLVRRYQAGASTRKLGAEIGVTHSTVRKLLLKAGVELRDMSAAGKSRARNPDAVSEILRRFDNGERIQPIRKALGMSRVGVVSVLLDHGRDPRANDLVIDVDDMVRRYQAGESAEAISAATGVSRSTALRRLRTAGVPIRESGEAARLTFQRDPARVEQVRAAQRLAIEARRRTDLDSAGIVASYQAGTSVTSLTDQHGCSPDSIVRILREAGVPIRNRSEAGLLRAAAEPDIVKSRRVEAARAVLLGKPIPQDVRERRAVSKHRNDSQIIGRGEEDVFTALTRAGFEVRRQVPVDRYNLDLAVDRLAIEVHTMRHGPHLDRFGRHERVDKLADLGWNVLYLWCCHGLNPHDLEKVVTFVDCLRREPPTPGQYWVLRCYGDRPPGSSRKSYKGAYIVTTCREQCS